MFHKIRNTKELKQFKENYNRRKESIPSGKMEIPRAVFDTAGNMVQILEECYGTERDAESEGGYLLISKEYLEGKTKKEYEMLMNQYHLKKETAEISETIAQTAVTEWWLELYIGSEWHLVFLYPKRKEVV